MAFLAMGCQIRGELGSFCTLFKFLNRKQDILSNTKIVGNRIISVTAKFIIND